MHWLRPLLEKSDSALFHSSWYTLTGSKCRAVAVASDVCGKCESAEQYTDSGLLNNEVKMTTGNLRMLLKWLQGAVFISLYAFLVTGCAEELTLPRGPEIGCFNRHC